MHVDGDGNVAQLFAEPPSTKMSILLIVPLLSVAVDVNVTAVDVVMPAAGECDIDTDGFVVSLQSCMHVPDSPGSHMLLPHTATTVMIFA